MFLKVYFLTVLVNVVATKMEAIADLPSVSDSSFLLQFEVLEDNPFVRDS